MGEIQGLQKPFSQVSRQTNVHRSSGLLLVLCAASLLLAQYPPNPGGYPGGGGVGGGGLPRIPFPRKKKPNDPAKPNAKVPLLQFTGVLKEKEAEQFTIQGEDTRMIEFKTTKTTKFLRDDKSDKPITLAEMQAGDELYVEASRTTRASSLRPR